MKATCALRELCHVDETEELVTEHFPAIFSATLTRIGCCADIQAPKKVQRLFNDILTQALLQGPQPSLDAIDAFKEFLSRSQAQYLFDVLDEVKYQGLEGLA